MKRKCSLAFAEPFPAHFVTSDMRIRLALLLLAVATVSQSPLTAQVTVTHLANEGFLLEGGGKKVLIDALFDGIDGYQRVSRVLAEKLNSASEPFDKIDLVLATHVHDDHFSPEPVRLHLQANPHAIFLSTPQAVDKLSRSGGSGFPPGRVLAVHPAEGEGETRELNGVQIEILNLHHGRDRKPPVQNLGFIIHLGGRRILHVGDTEASADEISELHLEQDPVDVALLPGWFLTPTASWRRVVRVAIRPKAIGAMHLAEEGAPAGYFGRDRTLQNRVESIQREFPAAVVFFREMQSHVF